MSMFNLNDQQLTQLSMEYDPAPLLQMLSQPQVGSNMVTQPGPEGVDQGPNSYSNLVSDYAQQPTTPTPKQVAPLDPTSLRTLAAMNPQRRPAPGTAGIPGRPGPLNLAPIAGPQQRPVPMSLAQILGR
jgi:hypothetical protein